MLHRSKLRLYMM